MDKIIADILASDLESSGNDANEQRRQRRQQLRNILLNNKKLRSSSDRDFPSAIERAKRNANNLLVQAQQDIDPQAAALFMLIRSALSAACELVVMTRKTSIPATSEFVSFYANLEESSKKVRQILKKRICMRADP